MTSLPKEAIDAAMISFKKGVMAAGLGGHYVSWDEITSCLKSAILAALPHLLGDPVAWRSRDLGDDWILSHSREGAEAQYPGLGCLIQPLYLAPTAPTVPKPPIADLSELVKWLPIATHPAPDIPRQVVASKKPVLSTETLWVRDADGRVYEAWFVDASNVIGRAHWWDLDGEDESDPVEWSPHPLSSAAIGYGEGQNHDGH